MSDVANPDPDVQDDPQRALQEVLKIMRSLRDPESGCPWDLKQTFATIVPHTLEEAYEVADAIEREDLPALRDELGDLFFQVVFYCQLAAEESRFDFANVAQALADKLRRRHPHVFGDDEYESDARLAHVWEQAKATEREEKGATSALDDVPVGLPALSRAQKVQKRAARAGMDWQAVSAVRRQLDAELEELDAVADQDEKAMAHELGDVLFTCVNLVRHRGLDAETLLRAATRRFETRFRHVEAAAKDERGAISEYSEAELDAKWRAAKQAASN